MDDTKPAPSEFAPWTDPNARPFVEFNNVTKRFGTFTAVNALNLSIYEREFFALLGPSGCGKTTMMRMLAGFEHPSEGEIRLDGVSVSHTPPYRLPVNMMFQSYALFPHMSVEKNIGFGLRQDQLPKGEIDARVEQMLAMVRLTPFAKRKPHQLSGGQRQRVALARSLAKQPKVLLLDEPLAALDRKLREETQFELVDIQERLGMTFIIVTHDQEEAMTVASRIAVMNEGRIVQVATPSEIYEEPNSRYVADFIGDVNLVEGVVASVSGEMIHLDSGPGRISIRQPANGFSAGAKAWFAIRPEKISISKSKPDTVESNLVAGEVWDIAYLGDVSVYHVRLPTGELFKATTANTTRLKKRPITWQDQVWLSWRDDGGVVLAD